MSIENGRALSVYCSCVNGSCIGSGLEIASVIHTPSGEGERSTLLNKSIGECDKYMVGEGSVNVIFKNITDPSSINDNLKRSGSYQRDHETGRMVRMVKSEIYE